MELQPWSSGISKDILRIEDGGSVIGAFKGDIFRFYQHWKGGRSVICTGRDKCSLCQSPNEDDRKATGRFRMTFAAYDEREKCFVPKVFEGGKKVFALIEELNKEHPIEKRIVKISRSGKGTQTQWMIQSLHAEKGILRGDAEKQVNAVPLLNLNPEAPEPEDEESDSAEPIGPVQDAPADGLPF